MPGAPGSGGRGRGARPSPTAPSALTFSPLGPESPLRPGSPGGPCGRRGSGLSPSRRHPCRGSRGHSPWARGGRRGLGILGVPAHPETQPLRVSPLPARGHAALYPRTLPVPALPSARPPPTPRKEQPSSSASPDPAPKPFSSHLHAADLLTSDSGETEGRGDVNPATGSDLSGSLGARGEGFAGVGGERGAEGVLWGDCAPPLPPWG